MAQKGYGNFSLKEVADRATLSKGIIHYYFKDKGELLILLLDRLTRAMDDLVNEKANRAKTPPGRIKAIFDASFESVSEKRIAFFQVLMDFCGQATKNKAIKSITAELYAKYRRLTRGILEDGIRQGIFRPIDTDELSTAIVGTVIGVSFQYMLDEEAFSLDKVQKVCEGLILSYITNSD
jgi:AcrR family transcriptional regulator